MPHQLQNIPVTFRALRIPHFFVGFCGLVFLERVPIITATLNIILRLDHPRRLPWQDRLNPPQRCTARMLNGLLPPRNRQSRLSRQKWTIQRPLRRSSKGFWLVNRNEYSNGKYNLRPVTDFSIFTGFTCCGPDDADRDLDDFIRDDAERHLQDKMAVTYGLFFPEKKLSHFPLAFFTLQNDALKIQSPGYPYKTPPAVKIGRFGVSFEFQSKGIGTDVLTMIKDFMCSDNRAGSP